MKRLRVLLLGPDCHPERMSIPYVTFSLAAALAQLHDVTLVVRPRVEDAIRRSKTPFHEIEVVQTQLFDRIEDWTIRRILKYKYDSQWKTAIHYPGAIDFEWCAWRKLRRRILAGEFDVTLRLLPMSPTIPSPFAYFLRKGPIPFVIGPINGGLPWPSGFSQLDKQREWIAGLRNLYRFLPFARSTYQHAAAIITASSNTYSHFSEFRDKLFFIPENGISRSVCCNDSCKPAPGEKLELIFVGGLIPLKACDLALRGAASLLRSGKARFTIVGDGREREHLEWLTRSLGIDNAVSFLGWVEHSEVFRRLQLADVMVFPSLREFGGGVVFEALAMGAVPVVADFGGPGDIVNDEVGYKIPLTNEHRMVAQIESVLEHLASDRNHLEKLRRQGIAYAREQLTWEAKARMVTQVLLWAVGVGPKPNMPPPKRPALIRNY